MPNANSKKENEIREKIYENLAKKSLDPHSASYDKWIFENYTKERLKSLGIIHWKQFIHFAKNVRFFQIKKYFCALTLKSLKEYPRYVTPLTSGPLTP